MSAPWFGPDDVLRVLSRHIGRRRGVRARELALELVGAEHADAAAERHLRRIVTELRMAGHHICGRPQEGYYLAETAEELDETCLFLYERAMTGLQQISRMKRISLPDLRGQLRLPG